MARLLVRSAPGVRSTSRRLIRVVGVAVSVGATSGAAETVMFSFRPATCSWKCTTGSVPETTTRFCAIWANPGLATLTEYSPIGTALNSNSPLASLFVVLAQSEDFARSITMAPCTRAVLRVVNDAANGAENRGIRGDGEQQKYCANCKLYGVSATSRGESVCSCNFPGHECQTFP